MKKILLLFSLIAFCLTSYGQFGKAALLPLVAGDTVVNTATSTKYITASAGYNTISLQPVVTRASGTLGGTIKTYGSLDEVNYVPIDTLTLSNVATYSDIVFRSGTPYVKYKIVFAGTGIMNARWKVYYLLRKTIVQ